MSKKERREMRQIMSSRAHFDKAQGARAAVAKAIKTRRTNSPALRGLCKATRSRVHLATIWQRTYLFGWPIGLAVTLRPTLPRRIRHVSRRVRAAKECLADLQ